MENCKLLPLQLLPPLSFDLDLTSDVMAVLAVADEVVFSDEEADTLLSTSLMDRFLLLLPSADDVPFDGCLSAASSISFQSFDERWPVLGDLGLATALVLVGPWFLRRWLCRRLGCTSDGNVVPLFYFSA